MMKSTLLRALALAIALIALPLGAAAQPHSVREDLPHAEVLLPNPPAFGTPEFTRDSVYYEWGLSMRDTERGALAVADANLSTEYMLSRFGAVMGKDSLNTKDYPATTEYLEYAFKETRSAISKAKKDFHRARPYVHFNHHSAIPSAEYEGDFYKSYPSGHSFRSWIAALSLAAADPQHQDQILIVGQDMCLSRVVVGFHYKSDTEAGILAASTCFARIACDEKFQQLRAAAAEELAR